MLGQQMRSFAKNTIRLIACAASRCGSGSWGSELASLVDGDLRRAVSFAPQDSWQREVNEGQKT